MNLFEVSTSFYIYLLKCVCLFVVWEFNVVVFVGQIMTTLLMANKTRRKKTIKWTIFLRNNLLFLLLFLLWKRKCVQKSQFFCVKGAMGEVFLLIFPNHFFIFFWIYTFYFIYKFCIKKKYIKLKNVFLFILLRKRNLLTTGLKW